MSFRVWCSAQAKSIETTNDSKVHEGLTFAGSLMRGILSVCSCRVVGREICESVLGGVILKLGNHSGCQPTGTSHSSGGHGGEGVDRHLQQLVKALLIPQDPHVLNKG